MKLEPPFLDDESIPAEIAVEEVRCAVCGKDAADPVAHGYDYEYETSRRRWTYVRCRDCGLVYCNPRPATSELARIYPPTYYSFDESRRGNPLVAVLRRRLEAMKVRKFRELLGDGPRRILDVGCGDGRFLGVLADFGPEDWELRGIDIDPGAVERAVRRGLDVTCARLEDYDGGGEGFDMVVLFQTLEHVSAPDAMCRKVRQLLKPGGVFVIETPDVAGWDERLFRSGLWGGYHIPRHWNLFDPSNLERMLDGIGFETVLKQPLISTSFWINSLYNRLLVGGAGQRTLAFFHYQNPLLLGAFIALDKLRMLFGARTSNQRLVARRVDRASDGEAT